MGGNCFKFQLDVNNVFQNGFLEQSVFMIHVNHAGFDDAKKNLLDNDCHHKKREECECMNTWF